jgi:hypothetical protein
MKILHVIILAVFSVGSLMANQGFFEEEWTARMGESFMEYSEQNAHTSAPTIEVAIHFADAIQKVLPTIFGHNGIPWAGKTLHADTVVLNHLRRIGISDMRMPGGNWSNKWLWNHEVPQNMTFRNHYIDSVISGLPRESWTMTTDHLVNFADSVFARPQPCVNYSIARYIVGEDRVEKAAGYAADWVRDINIQKGKEAKYWEVGNENYGKWQAGYIVSDLGQITGTEYGSDFRIFADSMRAADPSIKIGAVLEESDGNFNNWNQGVLPEIQDHADYLIIHEYFTWAQDLNDVSIEQVLNGIHKIGNNVANMKTMVEKYTNKSGDHFPIALTEYNMRAGVKNSAMISNLFVSMVLGEVIKHGYGLVNIWDIANGYNTTSGDHGILSRNDPYVPDFTPHPSFFAYYYYKRFMGDVMVSSTHTENNLYLYASRFSTGEAGIILINPTDTEKTITMNLIDFKPGQRAYWYSVAANDPEDRTIEINNNRGPENGFAPTNYWEIQPYSAPLGESFTFTAKPWSSNYIMLESDTNSNSTPPVSISSPGNETTSSEGGDNISVFKNALQPGILFLTQKANYTVLSLQGTTVQQGQGTVINLSTAPSGVYLLKLSNKVVVFIK